MNICKVCKVWKEVEQIEKYAKNNWLLDFFSADTPPQPPNYRISLVFCTLQNSPKHFLWCPLLNMTSLNFRFLAFISEAIEWAALSSKKHHSPAFWHCVSSPSTLYWLPPLLQLSIIFVRFLMHLVCGAQNFSVLIYSHVEPIHPYTGYSENKRHLCALTSTTSPQHLLLPAVKTVHVEAHLLGGVHGRINLYYSMYSSSSQVE